MVNVERDDDPIRDITFWTIRGFSDAADALIAEIVQLGRRAELERTFNLHRPPPTEPFETGLRALRACNWKDRKERGWDVSGRKGEPPATSMAA